jgi:hypothetical protein
MLLRVVKFTFAVVIFTVCFCGQNKGDTAKSASQAQWLGSRGAVDTSIVDSLSSTSRQKDEQSTSAAKDTDYVKEINRAMDSFSRKRTEMRSPAKKRKWLEDRFPSVAKALDGDSQLSGEITERYPDEINCIINSVISEYAQWEEFKYRSDSPMMDLLYFTSSPIRPISFRMFKLSGKSSGRACIWVEIWKMRSQADVKAVVAFINDHSPEWEMEYGLKTPKSEFMFKEYFILTHGCSFVVDRRVYGIDKHIRKRCFNCGTLDGESPKDAGYEYSCYSDKVVFGQNDKDW